jgi:uncharacterized membrane protein
MIYDNQDEFDKLLSQLYSRYDLASRSITKFRNYNFNINNDINNGVPLETKLAIIDTFIEKAINKITNRAHYYVTFAIAMGLIFSVISLVFINHLINGYYGITQYLSFPLNIGNRNIRFIDITHIKWNIFTFSLEMSRHLAIGAVTAAMLYLSAAFSKSFMREAAQLFNQRHKIRAVRIAIWLKSGDVSTEEIFLAFGVTVNDNSFDGINTENASNTPFGTAIGGITKVAEIAMDAIKKSKPIQN